MKGIAGMIEKLGAKAVLAVHSRRAQPGSKEPPRGFLVGHEITNLPGEIRQPVVLTQVERRKHIYVLGSTGCGKTNLLLRLMEDEIAAKRNCVVIDLRGDLIDRLILRLATSEPSEVKRIKLIDLREDDFVTPFNPLGGSGDHYTRALHLLEVIRHNSESWGVQLEETLRNSLIALSEGGRSLLDIEPLLDGDGFRQQVLLGVSDSHVRSFFDRYEALSKERRLTWSLPVLNKVTPLLAIPQLRRMLGSPSGFEWAELLDSPGQIVLIALAAHRFHSASHLIGGLLVSSLQSAVMARASAPEAKRNPVTLFLDEFETMASQSFGAIIAEGRRFGLSLVLSHQNLSQLDHSLRQVIRNNVCAQLFFQTGSGDAGDLAGDVANSEPKEAVRQALISQGVGEAFLIRRGQPSIQVATLHLPDPRTDPAKARDLKFEVLTAGCRARVDDDRQPSPSAPSSAHFIPTEVRHERLPKPGKCK